MVRCGRVFRRLCRWCSSRIRGREGARRSIEARNYSMLIHYSFLGNLMLRIHVWGLRGHGVGLVAFLFLGQWALTIDNSFSSSPSTAWGFGAAVDDIMSKVNIKQRIHLQKE